MNKTITLEFKPKLNIWDTIYLLSDCKEDLTYKEVSITDIYYGTESLFMPWVHDWSQIGTKIWYWYWSSIVYEKEFWEFNQDKGRLKYRFTKKEEMEKEIEKRKTLNSKA